jgi:uncharacterized membrane protein
MAESEPELGRPEVPRRALAAGLLVASALLVIQPVLSGTLPRIVAGGLLVFLLPGYALQTVLFGGASAATSDPPVRTRLALSLGSSPAIVGIVALLVNDLTGRITLDRVLPAVVVLTGLLLGGAWLQSAWERGLPDRPAKLRRVITHRLALFERAIRDRLATARGGPSGRRWMVIGLMLLALVGVVAAPAPQQQYTELALVTETDERGFTADGYPERLTAGATTTVTATVENNERTTRSYQLLVVRERPETGARERVAVREFDLEAGERAASRIALEAPERAGELEFSFQLFTSNGSQQGTEADPYRETRLIVDVQAGSEEGAP